MKKNELKKRLASAAKRGPVGAALAKRGAAGSGFHTPRKWTKADRRFDKEEG